MKLVENDLVGAVLLLILFGVIIAIAETWSRTRHPDPELPRKFIHICGGIGCLLFPFFIDSPLVVALLAAIFTITFAIGQKSTLLLSLSSVKRTSRGGEYFPIAVALLFYICQDHLWLYLSSLFILSFADAAAALIGCRFGKVCYQVGPDDTKSLEGSLAFLCITFLVVAVLLYSMTGLPLTNCVGAAFLAAVLLTGIEAVSIKGTDNIFIPILTCFILLKITNKPLAEILFQCLSMIAIFMTLQLLIGFFKIFSVRDAIIFQLFAYATWSLGSTDWSLPIFVSFMLYCMVRGLIASQERYEIGTAALLRVLAAPLFLLVLANGFALYEALYGPFLMAIIIAFTCSSWLYVFLAQPQTRLRPQIIAAGLSLCTPLILGITSKIFHSHSTPYVVLIPLTFISLTATSAYTFAATKISEDAGQGLWSRRILLSSGGGALAYFSLQAFGLVPYWHPAF